MRPFAFILTVVLLPGRGPADRASTDSPSKQRFAEAAIGNCCAALTRRNPRRVRRRQQRRTWPALRSGLGDDNCRRQERALRRGQGFVRRSALVPRRPVDRVSRPRRREERTGDCASRTAAARGSSRKWPARTRRCPGSSTSPTWSPDGKRIAFVSATPGPETADANGDPMVITRYLYKPDAAEGMTHFNDNRRLHLFVVDVASSRVDQLTDGNDYEHSVDWSPERRRAAVPHQS